MCIYIYIFYYLLPIVWGDICWSSLDLSFSGFILNYLKKGNISYFSFFQFLICIFFINICIIKTCYNFIYISYTNTKFIPQYVILIFCWLELKINKQFFPKSFDNKKIFNLRKHLLLTKKYLFQFEFLKNIILMFVFLWIFLFFIIT